MVVVVVVVLVSLWEAEGGGRRQRRGRDGRRDIAGFWNDDNGGKPLP